ncbi:MAG: HTH-type transcriptional activator CmpR [Verrucomicrobiota bacterium]
MKFVLSSLQLAAFCAVAKHLHLGRAAQELGVTSSALSHSLKALEDDLGCCLLERGSGPMRLTEIGSEVLRDADELLSKMQTIRERVRAEPSRVQDHLRIAATQTACHYLLPNVLREFVESFPKLQITMDPCDAPEAVRRLAEGQVDLAVCPRPDSLKHLKEIVLARDELRFLVPPAHPWTHRGRARDVESEAIIAPDRFSDSRRLIADHFAQDKLTITPRVETGSEEAIKQFVRLGIGIGILPEWTAREEVESGALCSIPLGRRRLTRTWVALHLKKHRLTIAESLFCDLCASVARELMGDHGRKI